MSSSIDVATLRDRIVEEALALEGARFHHLGRVEGLLDCIGVLVLAGSRAGAAIADRRTYRRRPNPKVLLAEIEEQMDRIEFSEYGPGDALLFWRKHPDRPQHAGIVTPVRRDWMSFGLLHADSECGQDGRVAHVPLAPPWTGWIHSAWRFRGES